MGSAPLVAVATNAIADRVASGLGYEGVFNLLIGTDDVIGERMIADRRLPLISATGSCRMGRHVGRVVAGRLGRCLLELGGNNGAIVAPSADLSLALRGIVRGLVFSPRVMLALVEAGMDRKNAYDLVQRNAMKSWEEELDFRELVKSDSEVTEFLTTGQMNGLFDYGFYLRHVDHSFGRLGFATVGAAG